MSYVKFTQLNVELIKNLPSSMKSELIILEDVIPDGIMASLCANDPFYKKERNDFLEYRPDILKKMYVSRGKRRRLNNLEDRLNFEVDEKVQFVKDYPQFKQLIESIIFEDKSGNIVKEIPIDQYCLE